MSSGILFAAVEALVRDGSLFVAALNARGNIHSAVEAALATVTADSITGIADGSSKAVGVLEELFRSRLRAAHAAGELPSGQEADELAAFYACVVLGLLGELLSDSQPNTLDAIRRSAIKALPVRTQH
jgi:hypothetical protein